MKKSIIKVLLCIITLIMITNLLFVPISAATNPYPSSQTINGVTTVPCTYYAWQQVYDRLGKTLPNWGNAINWLDRAASAGYSTGSVAKANSIAVWKSSAHSYGHVSFVTAVNGNYMTVNEGGMTNSSGGAANGTGIVTGSTVSSVVGTKKSAYSSCTLLGFIYLSGSSSNSVSVSSHPSKNTITNTNAILWGRVDKPLDYTVTKIGIEIRRSDSTYSNGWSKYEAPSWNYEGEPEVYPYYNLNTELSLTLSPGTEYYYRIYAKVNGTEYWSTETKFTTTGSHTHNYTIHGYEAAHPHKYYKKCSCGDYYYTGETEYLSNCSTCANHECDKGEYVWSWDAHPHHSCYKCSICGEVWADKSSSNILDSCSICNALEKPIITIAKEEYYILSEIEISWTKVDRATHYKLCVLQKERDKDYSTIVLEEDYITNNSYIVQNLFEELPIGEYCVYIYAYDNQNYNDKLNDWNNQKSDPVYFKIYTTAMYYDWNFDYDTFKDSLTKGSDTSYYEKNIINSKKVYNTDELLTNIDYQRIGYKLIGWEVQFSPFETFGDITMLIYGIQAQYELIADFNGDSITDGTDYQYIIDVYTGKIKVENKAEICDMNGDGKFDIRDIIAINEIINA